jgi:hypothetical protein
MLPDLEAYAMKPDRLRDNTWCEIDHVRGLRRSNTLATAIAQTTTCVFALSPPQGTVRKGSLAQARPNRERRRAVVHVGAPRSVGRQVVRRRCYLAPFRAGAQRAWDCRRRGSRPWLRPGQRAATPHTRPMPNRRISRKVQQCCRKTCSLWSARNLSACLRWPQCAHRRSPLRSRTS